MKKIIKLISVLIGLYIFIIQVFVSCGENYTQPKSSKLLSQVDKINYISNNFDEYKSRIKDESGVEGKLLSGVIDGNKEKYIEFNIDNATEIKFVVNSTETIITKQLEPSKEFNYTRKIEMDLFGIKEDDNIMITLLGNGSIHCNYNANDLEHPLPSQKEKDEGIDHQIKLNMSTEELEELSAKAHSIYNVFEEICKEYNENNEK